MKNPNTLHWKEENNGRDTVPKTPEFKRLTSNARSLSFKALMKRNSTFWPSTEEILSKRPSLEFLNPEFYSKTRKSSPLSAIFNLVATVCGGGVLTLPIAFSRAGIIPSTILMIFSAYITDFAMYILCAAARRTGGRSYGDVARLAFGAKAEIFVTLLLFTFLYFVIVAYLVLVKDIWTPMIMHMFPTLHQWCIERWNIDPDTSKIPGDVFLIGFIVVSLPLLLNKDIYALRHTCYVGFASLLILVVAIVKKAYEVNFVTNVGIFHNEVKWWHDDINDVIYAFPIIALSFFSIYNVLSVHSALTNPTRERMKFVLDWTIILCLVLFYTVGLCGYLYAYNGTLDNILLNFPLSCRLVFIGRVGYGFTLMFGLPLVVLPCREALLTTPVLIKKWINSDVTTQTTTGDSAESSECGTLASHYCAPRQNRKVDGGHLIINGIDFDEEKPLMGRSRNILSRKVNSNDADAKKRMSTNTGKAPNSLNYGSVSNATSINEDCDHDGTSYSGEHLEVSGDSDADEEEALLESDSDLSIESETTDGINRVPSNMMDISDNMSYASTLRSIDENFMLQCEKHSARHLEVNGSDIRKVQKGAFLSEREVHNQGGKTDVDSSANIPSTNSLISYDSAYTHELSSNNGAKHADIANVVKVSSSPGSAKKAQMNRLKSNEINEEFADDSNDTLANSMLVHVLSTLFLLIGGYIFAIAAPGVGVIWSICGSSMSLIIGFFIPAACYLKIRSRKRLNPRSLGAWCLAIFAVLSSIICTYNIVMNILKE